MGYGDAVRFGPEMTDRFDDQKNRGWPCRPQIWRNPGIASAWGKARQSDRIQVRRLTEQAVQLTGQSVLRPGECAPLLLAF